MATTLSHLCRMNWRKQSAVIFVNIHTYIAWQIGIDVLPEYRRKGIASSLTSALAAEVIKRGKVPFYCSAWSNIRSVKNAIRSGFRPAWVQVMAKKNSMISDMNK